MKTARIFISITSILVFLTTGALQTFAASSFSLSPASGNLDADGTTLTLNFNSDGTSVAGASIKISFTGSASYVSSASTACNQSFDVQQGTGAIIVSCLFSDTKTVNGALATFIFKSNASSGESTFTLSDSDPSGATLAGGTYTLVSTSDGEGLPDAGISDWSLPVIIGFVLILFGLGMYSMTKREERLLLEKSNKEYEEFINSPKMIEKLKRN